MKCLVGLGNPGSEYAQTRHNAGRIVLELIRQELGLPVPKLAPRLQSVVAKQGNWLVVEPTTYMNQSGLAVQSVCQYYQLSLAKLAEEQQADQLFVFHDDLDLELGAVKVQFGTGPKVHNGLQSIYDILKTDQFWHVRIGIDTRQGDRSMPGQAYVLQKMSNQELKALEELTPQVVQQL